MGNRDLVANSHLADICLGNPSEHLADVCLGNPSDDDPGLPDAPDAFDNFIADSHLRAVGVSPEGLADSTADIEARHRQRYLDIVEQASKKIASQGDAAPAEPDPQALMKRYMGQPRCRDKRTVRLEKSENGRWIMEYDARGELISGHAWGFWPEEKGEPTND